MSKKRLFIDDAVNPSEAEIAREQAGKVWLVTGAGRRTGIGASILREAVARGANAVAFTTTERGLPQAAGVKAELEKSGIAVLMLQGDVTAPGVADSWVNQVVSAFGRLDVVINNIGAGGAMAPLVETAPEQVRETMEINFFGNLWVATAAIRQMRAQSPVAGQVVFTGSMAYRGAVNRMPYGIAKAALVGAVAGLAKEYPELKFYVLNPRLTRTDMIADYTDQQIQRVLQSTGQPGIDTAADVAAAFLDLLSPSSNAVSGATYAVTGDRLN